MAVVTADKYRNLLSHAVDQRGRRQLPGTPLRLIPVPAEHPCALRSLCCLRCYPTPEFLRGGGVVQLHFGERRTAVGEVHVRVIEAGQQQLAVRVNDSAFGSAPWIDLGHGS